MRFIELTFPTPAENLACDEALLNMCEDGFEDEVLRFWEPRQYFVVLGYSGRIAREVQLPYCARHCIPVLRRYSGGGTVAQGPGCLNFTLILQLRNSGPLQSIRGTNTYVLQRHKEVLESIVGTPVDIRGHSDLSLDGMKFSGNAQRRRERFLLFHGTFLLDFNISFIQHALPLPSAQPSYRRNRSHEDFLTNLKVPGRALREAIRGAWHATEMLHEVPLAEIIRLTNHRYLSRDWIFRL
jgi:lipoate---protein ligase